MIIYVVGQEYSIVQVLSAFIVTDPSEQSGSVQPHRVNEESTPCSWVKVTVVPWVKSAVQGNVPQPFIPAGWEVTVPVPVLATVFVIVRV